MANLSKKEWTIMLNHMDGYMPEEEFEIYKEISEIINSDRFSMQKFNTEVKGDSHLAKMLGDSLSGRFTVSDKQYLPVALLRIARQCE